MTSDPTVEIVGPGDLDASTVATGATWESVFETERVALVRSRLDGDATTAWHTHGERDAYGTALAGTARIEYGPDDEDAVDVSPGEFFWMQAGTRHRHVIVSSDEWVALVALVGTGAPLRRVDGPPNTTQPRRPRVAGRDDLVPTDVLANLVRLTPFPDAPVQQVRGHADGRVASTWHHHGNNDVFGHVLEGEGYVEWGTGEGERELAHTGSFFHVPPEMVHRDVNPGDGPQEYLLWLTGTEPRTVPVDGPATDD